MDPVTPNMSADTSRDETVSRQLPFGSPTEGPNAGPKQYIRTFASDKETLEKGGTPDLTPLANKSATMSADAVSMRDASRQLPFGSPAAGPPPTPVPPAAPQPTPTPQPQTVIKPTPLQTYAGDFSKQMKQTQASSISILAAEQDALQGTSIPAPSAEESKKNKIYLSIGTALLVLGTLGAVFAYLRYQGNMTPIMVSPSATAPIFVDEREEVAGTGATLLRAVEASMKRPLARGTVRYLYITSTTTTTNVFSALELPAPGILLRNIEETPGMAGIVNAKGSQSLFFILTVSSYGDTFAGMLSWEPSLLRDLATLYPPYSAPAAPVIPIATTTATTTAAKAKKGTAPSAPATTTPSIPPAPIGFVDEVVSNHDVRAYRDALGKSVFIYGYWNKTTLVIARDPESFTEILNRLATSRTEN